MFPVSKGSEVTWLLAPPQTPPGKHFDPRNMTVKEMRLPERGAGEGREYELSGSPDEARAKKGLYTKPGTVWNRAFSEFNGELELRAAQNKTEQRGRSI